jgi:hypothetical protein
MEPIDCPYCAGTGYTEDAEGEEILCPMCGGTGVLLTQEDGADLDG